MKVFKKLGLLFLCLFLLSLGRRSMHWADHDWSKRSSAITCTTRPISQEEREAEIHYLALQEQQVLAQTIHGLYRASEQDQEWQAVVCEGLPLRGQFVQTYDDILLYLLPVHRVPKEGWTFMATIYPELSEIITPPPPPEGPNGHIFASTDQGSTWYEVSDAYQFMDAFLHRDGTLYGIATTPITPPGPETQGMSWIVYDKEKRGYFVGDKALMSEDYGQTWRDITEGTGSDIRLDYFIEDPETPQLVAIQGSGRRGYIYTAENKDYVWEIAFAPVYWLNIESDARFFSPDFLECTLQATLANYFTYEFGDQEKIPKFRLETERSDYTFALDQPKLVTLTLQMLLDTESEVLVDTASPKYAWVIRVVDPSGKRSWGSDFYWLDEETTVEYCQYPALQYAPFGPQQPYTRSMDLGAFADSLFSMPGEYKVQVMYRSWDCEATEWLELTAVSPPFTVKVTE